MASSNTSCVLLLEPCFRTDNPAAKTPIQNILPAEKRWWCAEPEPAAWWAQAQRQNPDKGTVARRKKGTRRKNSSKLGICMYHQPVACTACLPDLPACLRMALHCFFVV
jgi:hypothetical protein